MPHSRLNDVPDELVLRIFAYLDVPDLLSMTRVSLRFREVALDPLLHSQRLHASSLALSSFLPQRPRIQALQPPVSFIYLTRTHVAARKLGFSLALVSLNRSLSRRPPLSTLVEANIVPRDCCRRHRESGEMVITTGSIVEKKRKVEREQIKEGLRVWLDRKAGVIGRRKDVLVGVLVWRFSRCSKLTALDSGGQSRCVLGSWERPETGKVNGLKRFFEDIGDSPMVH